MRVTKISLVEPAALQSGAADLLPNHIASATPAPGLGNEILVWKTASSRLSVNLRCHFDDLSCIMSPEKPALGPILQHRRRAPMGPDRPASNSAPGAYLLFACGSGDPRWHGGLRLSGATLHP